MLNTLANPGRRTAPGPRPRIARMVFLMAAVLLAWTGALAPRGANSQTAMSSHASLLPTASRTLAEAPPAAVPAYRQADKVVVITMAGPIDAVTAMSMRRRIAAAELGGANAIVIDINSPGGEVGAVLEITNAIKASSIDNTVAWINPDAYSGGAIVALACREIVVSSPSSMGDAFPVTMTSVPGQNRMGLRGLTPDERTKILPVLLADVTDSARRNGWDEYMVQAIVIDGIELWWVEDTADGTRLAVNEEEFRMLFGRAPVRGRPLLAGVTGGVREARSSQGTSGSVPAPESPDPDTESASEDAAPAGDRPSAIPPTAPSPAEVQEQAAEPFRPASDTLEDVAREFALPERSELRLDRPSQRPVLTPADAGRFTDLGYLTDGTAPIVLRDDQMLAFGFSATTIRTDDELRDYFGAVEMVRSDESWSERLVRFMTSGMVRGVLIVVMLIALFLEMMSPGLTVPGVIAAAALVLLLAPPALIGAAGWWEFVAIGIGVVLLGIEIFVLPGFGLFGVLGVVALFAGLLGTFIPAGGTLSNPATQQEMLRGATIILLSVITAGVGMYLIARHFNRLPFLDRLVLGASPGDEEEDGARADAELLRAAARVTDLSLAVGMTGVAVTALRPAGTAEIDGRIFDVVAGLGVIDPGAPIRVVAVERFRIVVEENTPEGTA
jgi:membrane-bound serine protease (ClpP class)